MDDGKKTKKLRKEKEARILACFALFVFLAFLREIPTSHNSQKRPINLFISQNDPLPIVRFCAGYPRLRQLLPFV